VCFFQGKAAIPLLWKFFNKWANPDDTRKADPAAVAKLLTPLGLHQKRAQIIIRFSGDDAPFYSDNPMLSQICIYATSLKQVCG
jgi:hypothetical protein